MATPQLRIDASLGNGWYREWQEMDGQAKAQEARYNASRMRLKLPITSPLLDRIYDDLVILNKIEKDYQQGMGVILSGRRLASTEQLKRVHDLYTLALGCADQENDILEALFATGFAAAWVLFPWVLLQAKANSMLDALAKLRRALKEAEHEVSNARNKRAFHLAVAFFEAMFPEISLTARVGIFLSDVAVDKVLGPKIRQPRKNTQGLRRPE
jgi:uncharacterized membrane protein YciS (DUF1049 family)